MDFKRKKFASIGYFFFEAFFAVAFFFVAMFAKCVLLEFGMLI
jgi:hypothetical protein